MTLDKAINFVENMIYNYRNYERVFPYGEQLKDWNRLLKLLRWYVEQDLIKKEDAINAIEDTDYDRWDYTKEDYGFSVDLIEKILNGIPKAEPPHHIGEVIEPYMPKENG